jgi:hypothetical protein
LESSQDYLESLLKLGQFDRDQSDFEHSNVELSEALDLAKKKFSNDPNLMSVALNSYADLMRQTGDTAKSKALTKEAQQYNTRATGSMDDTPTDGAQ